MASQAAAGYGLAGSIPCSALHPFSKRVRPNQTSGFLPLQLAEVAPADMRFWNWTMQGGRARHIRISWPRGAGCQTPGGGRDLPDHPARRPLHPVGRLHRDGHVDRGGASPAIRSTICAARVPIDRSDDAYFRPLRNLTIPPQTELFLGLVHSDGVDARRNRIEAAVRHVPDFSIATECGMARCRTPQLVRRLLHIHADASAEPKPQGYSATQILVPS